MEANVSTISNPANATFIPHYWIDSYDALTGLFTQTQPTFDDISGNILLDQLPIATTSSLGLVEPDGVSISIANGVISTTGNIISPVNIGPIQNEWINSYDALTGEFTLAQPSYSNISGTISSGSLPTPTQSSRGGIYSSPTVGNNFVYAIASNGVPLFSQPVFANIGGQANVAQIPIATANSLGIVEPDNNSITIANGIITAVSSVTPANLSSTANEWVNGYNATTGTWEISQPNFSNISGKVLSNQLPLATASNVGGVTVDNVSIFVNDGVLTAPSSVTPENVPANSNLWMNGYNSTTGNFSLGEINFSNIQGNATISQLPQIMSTILGFVINSGDTGNNVGPELVSSENWEIVKCTTITKTSDTSTPFEFSLNQNGNSIFSSNPILSAGTSTGNILQWNDFSSINISANDLFTIDIIQGSSSWAATILLQGYLGG
ncbi:Uncharacterised protein [uncultured archaeon]|nr:Uncharacterised protein [uncultured archaeon]